MTLDMVNRLLYVVVYTGGTVAFWQITKHMPKVFHTLLEYIIVSSFAIVCVMPVVGLVEYILGGNIDNTMMFVGSLCGASFLSVLWMTLVALSREWQGKEQYKYRFL
jgi:hypothetical protein